jgi:hypothetical protein
MSSPREGGEPGRDGDGEDRRSQIREAPPDTAQPGSWLSQEALRAKARATRNIQQDLLGEPIHVPARWTTLERDDASSDLETLSPVQEVRHGEHDRSRDTAQLLHEPHRIGEVLKHIESARGREFPISERQSSSGVETLHVKTLLSSHTYRYR